MTEEETLVQAEPEAVPEQPSRRELWANRLRHFLLGVVIACTVGVGYLILTRGVSSPGQEVTFSTYTPTHTPTITLTPTRTATRPPPTETPTPGPTPTLPPPRRHKIGAGDTWLGLAIYYDVSLESVLALNGRSEDDYVQVDEEVLIPYPTYTPTPDVTQMPTLEVIQELKPEQCREHIVAAGETLISIALNYELNVQIIQSVNNITDPDLVQEGQKLCIPQVTPGPAPSPTFGPSPTPEDELLHPAPQLLYPPAEVEVPPGSQQVTLQWTVVGFLDPDELYMVEIRNLSRPDARALRGFVKTTTWRLPDAIRPAVGAIETFAWRVSVIKEKELASADLEWERSGLPSSWQKFMWMGVSE